MWAGTGVHGVVVRGGVLGVTLAVGAAVGWQIHQPVLCSAAMTATLAAVGIGLMALGWVARVPYAQVVACALLAWASTEWRAQQRLSDTLSPAQENEVVWVTGVVTDLPVVRREGWRFDLLVEQIERRAVTDAAVPPVPRRIRVSVPAISPESVGGVRPWPTAPPRAGQRWRWHVRWRYPDGVVNPEGADPAFWAFERGIGAVATAWVGTGVSGQWLGETGTQILDRWRQDWRDRIHARLGFSAVAGVIAALSVGDQAAIEQDDWRVFRATGITHLVSISGVHVTMLAWCLAALVDRLWRCSARALLCCPAPVVARWVGLGMSMLYAALAGWGVPAQRTVLMLTVVAVLRSQGRRWPGWRVLCAAALAVMVWDPWAVGQPGFWLSFVAVALLMGSGTGTRTANTSPAPAPGIVTEQDRQPAGRLRAGWHALQHSQAVVTVGLAPWTLIFFQQVSLIGGLANAVAIPVITLVVTPLSLLGGVWPPLWSLAASVTAVLMQALGWAASLPWATWSAPAAPWWAQALAVCGAGVCVLPLPWRLRAVGVVLMWPLLWPAVPRPSPGEFELLAADIGQGNAVLVRTAHHALLYDSGPAYGRYGEMGNAGERVLVPLLQALGVQRLDVLMLTHRDTDHTGGAAAVLSAIPVSLVQSALEPGHPLRERAPHQRCSVGLRWVWDGVQFEVLHPEEADHDRPGVALLRPNTVSCVLRISSATSQRHALLTGDIGVDQELRLLLRHSAELPADVLLVPHHGSTSSSSLTFISRIQPRWAIVQAGRHNRYGHPAASVLARYQAQQVTVIRTSQCGAWHWSSADATDWCARKRAPHYWRRDASGE